MFWCSLFYKLGLIPTILSRLAPENSLVGSVLSDQIMLTPTCTDNVSRLLSVSADGSPAVQIKSETVLSSSFYPGKQFEYWNFVEFPRPQLLASDICFSFLSSRVFFFSLAISRLSFIGLCTYLLSLYEGSFLNGVAIYITRWAAES